VLLALLLAAAPVVEKRGTTHVLVLPPAMEAALKAYDPNFAPFPESHFDPESINGYPYGAKQAPFAVVGDMNGDGVPDAVIAGRGSRRAVLVCVMSEGKGFRAFEIAPWPGGREIVLYHQDPGRVEQPEDSVDHPEESREEPLDLTTDAFQVISPERGGVLYYWSRGKFRRAITSD
jgi:hypothetical protein